MKRVLSANGVIHPHAPPPAKRKKKVELNFILYPKLTKNES